MVVDVYVEVVALVRTYGSEVHTSTNEVILEVNRYVRDANVKIEASPMELMWMPPWGDARRNLGAYVEQSSSWQARLCNDEPDAVVGRTWITIVPETVGPVLSHVVIEDLQDHCLRLRRDSIVAVGPVPSSCVDYVRIDGNAARITGQRSCSRHPVQRQSNGYGRRVGDRIR